MIHRLGVKCFETCEFTIVAIEAEFIMALVDGFFKESAQLSYRKGELFLLLFGLEGRSQVDKIFGMVEGG